VSISAPLATAGDVGHLFGATVERQYLTFGVMALLNDAIEQRTSDLGLSDTTVAILLATPTLDFVLNEGGAFKPLMVVSGFGEGGRAAEAFATEVAASRLADGAGVVQGIIDFRDEVLGPEAVVAGTAVLTGVNGMDATIEGSGQHGLACTIVMTGGAHIELIVDEESGGITYLRSTEETSIPATDDAPTQKLRDTTPLGQQTLPAGRLRTLWALGRLNNALTARGASGALLEGL